MRESRRRARRSRCRPRPGLRPRGRRPTSSCSSCRNGRRCPRPRRQHPQMQAGQHWPGNDASHSCGTARSRWRVRVAESGRVDAARNSRSRIRCAAPSARRKPRGPCARGCCASGSRQVMVPQQRGQMRAAGFAFGRIASITMCDITSGAAHRLRRSGMDFVVQCHALRMAFDQRHGSLSRPALSTQDIAGAMPPRAAPAGSVREASGPRFHSSTNASSRLALIEGRATITTSSTAAISRPADSGRVTSTSSRRATAAGRGAGSPPSSARG